MNTNNCSVPNCARDPKHACFPLPSNNFKAKIWRDRCSIEKYYDGVPMVCEAHFHKAIINSAVHPKRLKKSAIPTLNLPSKTTLTTTPQSNKSNATLAVAIPSETFNVKMATLSSYSNFMETKLQKFFEKPSDKSLASPPNLPTDTSNQATDIEPCHIGSITVENTEIKNELLTKSDDVTVIPIDSQAAESSILIDFAKSKNTAEIPNLAYRAVSTMIELQQRMQYLSKHVFKILGLKMYLKCPQGYKMLLKILQLPPVSELRSFMFGCTISTDINTPFTLILQYKLEMMAFQEPHCILCVGTIDVEKRLYYDIKRDTLVGVCDINNIQKPEPANKILVLSMQGIYYDWKQPIDIAYLSTPCDDNLVSVNQWIDRNFDNLMSMGFGVRAIVYETDNILKLTSPHHHKYRKIYCLYDITSLLRWFFYIFLTHDYVIEGERATLQHILDYYKLDSKNIPRLSPKITQKVFNPNTIQDVNVNDVMDILSMKTAAAMTLYIKAKLLDPEAKNTVKLITEMSTIFDILCSKKCEYASKDDDASLHLLEHKRVLLNIINIFNDLKIVNRSTQMEVAEEDTFLPKFKLTLKSIAMYYEDMLYNNSINILTLQQFSLESMRPFFDQINPHKRDNTKPTCKKVYFAFKRSALLCLFKSTQNKSYTDLETNLIEMKNLLNNFKTLSVQKESISSKFKIKCSEYNTLDFKNKDTIVFLAGFLLKKCYDYHSNCVEMKNYTFIVLQNTSSIWNTILKDIQESVCVVPPESFIEFVEMMEIRFRSFMTKNVFQTQMGFINGLLTVMQPVTFPVPCQCFPMIYAKKLYLRLRIYNMLKYNNICYSASPTQHKYVVVNNL